MSACARPRWSRRCRPMANGWSRYLFINIPWVRLCTKFIELFLHCFLYMKHVVVGVHTCQNMCVCTRTHVANYACISPGDAAEGPRHWFYGRSRGADDVSTRSCIAQHFHSHISTRYHIILFCILLYHIKSCYAIWNLSLFFQIYDMLSLHVRFWYKVMYSYIT